MRAEVPLRERWLALGILLALLVLAYLLLLHRSWSVPMLALSDEIEALQQRDLRARMEVRRGPAVRERVEAAEAELVGVPGFMPEANAQLATAALIQRLEHVVAQASPGNRSCAITHRGPLAGAARQRFAHVVVQARLACGNAELVRVLYALEHGVPRLFVDNLNLLAGAPRTGQGGGVDVSFDLYGYLRPVPEGIDAD